MMQGEPQSAGVWHSLRVAAVGRRPKRTLARMAVLIVVCAVTFTFVLIPVRVVGLSMEPTCHNRSVNFINRLAYVIGRPQRGDVVGINMSTTAGSGNFNRRPEVMLLKRVVGLPGESVSFVRGHVCINGQEQEEPYLKFPTDWQMAPITLGPDEFYVVGDNRSMPREAHTQGAANRRQIVGRILWRGNQ